VVLAQPRDGGLSQACNGVIWGHNTTALVHRGLWGSSSRQRPWLVWQRSGSGRCEQCLGERSSCSFSLRWTHTTKIGYWYWSHRWRAFFYFSKLFWLSVFKWRFLVDRLMGRILGLAQIKDGEEAAGGIRVMHLVVRERSLENEGRSHGER
jgi:hypothetical protein